MMTSRDKAQVAGQTCSLAIGYVEDLMVMLGFSSSPSGGAKEACGCLFRWRLNA